MVAVIGPNGAGKTTLLSILAGVQRPSAGTLVHGEGATGSRVGWVPQNLALYSKLTVAENLRLFARLERVEDPEAAVARMLEQTGLADRADDRVARLSGGNRQRVNVALGLLADPPVVLLDEPTSALDPTQRERLWGFIGGWPSVALASCSRPTWSARPSATPSACSCSTEVGSASTVRPTKLLAEGGAEDFERAFVAFLAQAGIAHEVAAWQGSAGSWRARACLVALLVIYPGRARPC